MKTMSLEEKQKYIAEKQVERVIIQKEISDLSKKRDKYVAAKQLEDGGNMLDKAIVQAVKKQAVAKNFIFVEE